MPDKRHLILQDRDYALLKSLSDYRYLTTSQVRERFFSKGPFVYRRLKKLADYGLTVRLRREVIGEASELLHALAPEGARQLGLRRGVPSSTFTVHRKGSRLFLEHQLMVNEFRLAFEQAAQRQKGLSIEQWEERHKLSIPGRKVLFPDAYVVFSTPRGKAHFFVEVDRGTEPVRRVFREKLQSYAAYHRSGSFAQKTGAKLFRVLTVTLHEQAMRTLLVASQGITPSSTFWFTHRDLTTAERVLTGAIWKRADRVGECAALYQDAQGRG